MRLQWTILFALALAGFPARAMQCHSLFVALGELPRAFRAIDDYLTLEEARRLDHLLVRAEFVERQPTNADYAAELARLAPIAAAARVLRTAFTEHSELREVWMRARGDERDQWKRDLDAATPLLYDAAERARETLRVLDDSLPAEERSAISQADTGRFHASSSDLVTYLRTSQMRGVPWSSVREQARARVVQLLRATSIEEARQVSPNHFDYYKKGKKFEGWYSVRVDSKFRILFLWDSRRAIEIRIEDYHGE